jgi:Right handed beta helix region/Carbohydrate binding domain
MKNCNLLLAIASLCCATNALAATYYVDAKNGNDNWSGTASTVSGTNGPWQSIAKVNSAALKPSDQVLFSCGQTWYETLKPSTNGTTTAKIYFGSYPSLCANKPKITGFRSIPSQSWQLHQGNIWKTTFPQNLIINGNLSASVSNWLKHPSDASQTFNSTCPLSVAGCMNFVAGTSTGASVAISNTFPIESGKKYTVTVSFYATSDTSFALMARENSGSYKTLGLNQWGIAGNGQWKDFTLQFTATHTVSNARLDIQIPKSKQLYLRYASVVNNDSLPQPSTVLFDGNPVNISHHPNAGHDTSKPNSVYLLTTAPSPTIKDATGKSVSSAIVVPNLKLPAGAAIVQNTKLRLRNFDYEVNDFSVTGLSSNTLSIAPNTKYPVTEAGWGFYFYDALWMLDSAGEWYFDASKQTLYLWTPTSENPGNKVFVATLNTAIDLRTRLNLTLENLEINGATTGIDMASSQNVTLQHLNISNIKGVSIYAQKAATPTIALNKINRVGMHGIDADYSSNAKINNNELTEIGVFVKAGKRISLPMATNTAIRGGAGSIIEDNLIADTGRFGIIGENDSDISYNVVRRSCLTLNDCGAIYLYSGSPRTVIHNNLVLDVAGDTEGTPHGRSVAGIYLDSGISGIQVTGNTVKGSTSSVLLHNSAKTNISNNILYGSEGRMLYQQEDKYVNNVLSENSVTNNQFFPTINNVVIDNTTTVGNITKFATYSKNHYSTIHSPYIVSEKDYSIGLSNAYSLQDWQQAETNGVLRNNDLDSATAAPLTSFAPGKVGSNVMVNGDFSGGVEGWGHWNATAPLTKGILEGCLPTSANCLHVTTGGSTSVIYSPSFAVTKGKRYRIAFDLKSTVTNGVFYPRIRFAGPTNYTALTNPLPYPIPASTAWKRYSFVFEANASAENPTLNNQGARFDLDGLPKSNQIWIANLEVVPFDPGVFGTPQSELLVNDTDIDKSIDCPTRTSNPALCSNFVRFPEGTTAVWPISVPPRSGRIVFTQNLTLLDSDGDGIANSQDQCTSTAKGLIVDREGCSLAD